MKYSFQLALVLLLAGIAGCNNKAKENNDAVTVTGTEAYADSASSSVRVYDDKGRICIQQSSTYYEVVNYYDGTNKVPLLMKVNKIELCVADSINKHKVYKVSAKSVTSGKNVEWNAEFVATDIRFQDNTLMAVYEGGDSEEDFIKRFSLGTGAEVFSCSYSDMKVAIPNVRDKRFIGYTSQSAVSKPVQELNEENLLALISFGSSAKPISTLKLKLKRNSATDNIATYTPEMQLVSANSNTSVIDDGKSIILMKADEKYTSADVTDFAVQYTFYFGPDNEATRVTIPVKNDNFDLKAATYDGDIFELVSR